MALEKLKDAALKLLHLVLPNPDFKKLGWAAGLGVASYFVLGYLLPAVLSIKLVALVGAGAVGYLIYTKVAMWEIERAVKAVQGAADKVVDTAKDVVK